MKNSPCKDCPDRKVTADFNCHSHCESYDKFQAYIKLRRKIRWEQEQQRQIEYDVKHKIRRIAQKREADDRGKGNAKM